MESRFIYNSVTGKENIHLQDRETEEILIVDLKKGDFVEFVKTINELADTCEILKKALKLAEYQLKVQDRILKEMGE